MCCTMGVTVAWGSPAARARSLGLPPFSFEVQGDACNLVLLGHNMDRDQRVVVKARLRVQMRGCRDFVLKTWLKRQQSSPWPWPGCGCRPHAPRALGADVSLGFS